LFGVGALAGATLAGGRRLPVTLLFHAPASIPERIVDDHRSVLLPVVQILGVEDAGVGGFGGGMPSLRDPAA
jgi:hypothetical protein